MLDIKFVRENPDAVKENIRKKFQDHKLVLVDQVIEEDQELRIIQQEADQLRSRRKTVSKEIGSLMKQGKKEEAETVKKEVSEIAGRLEEMTARENELRDSVTSKMLQIPQMIDPSVPIGRDDTENVELQKFGEPVTPDFAVPYHTEIMETFDGIDLNSAGRVSGNGFYYLMGDIARDRKSVV